MLLRALSLAVVGAHHPNKRGPTRLFELALCVPGEAVHLVPEPKNKADPYAIAVYSAREVQIGYLTAERAPLIGKWIGEGREVQAIFHHRTAFGAAIRAAFDGEVPSIAGLPTPEAKAKVPPAEPDFYPDDEWPDE